MKKTIVLFLLAALLGVSCQKNIPENKEPVRVSIPFELGVTVSKVSYEGGTYAIKSGDQLYVEGTVRDDISGTLSNDGEKWSGLLWYDEDAGEPDGDTDLKVTLLHADNPDKATYAHGIAYQLPPAYEGTLLQYAVENFSLLTDEITFGSTSVTLSQQACFINTTVSFEFVGVGNMPAGETSVDVLVNESLTVSGRANLEQTRSNKVYTTHFIIALPGGTQLTDGTTEGEWKSVIQICDRDVPMRNSGDATLVRNKIYNMEREYQFRPQLGDPYWSDGTYGRVAHEEGVDVVGIIVFVNNYDDDDDSDLADQARAITEKDYGFGHALVMSLTNAASSVKWGPTTSSYTDLVTTPNSTLDTDNVSGYHNTSLQAGCTAADYATGFRPGDEHEGIDSGWFLPSIGQ